MLDSLKEYPAFFETVLQNVTDTYNTLKRNNKQTSGFVFITDVHIHLNGRASVPLIIEIGKRTGVDTVVCGGDHCWAFGSKAQCLADFKDSLTYMDPIRDTMKLYHARGNHDVTVRSSMELDTGFTMPYEQVQEMMLMHTASACGSVEGKLYYYTDDIASKVRYIILDTSEFHDADCTPWGVQSGMEAEQLQWLVQTALQLPDNEWASIVVGHIPCTPEIPGYSSALDDLRSILEAFKNKTDCALGDFRNATGELIAYICGHNHKDRDAVTNGLLHISTGCDSYCMDDGMTRNVGEAENTLFDLCLVNKADRTLQLFRVGAGKDRRFHY